jgi:hypothetical protein
MSDKTDLEFFQARIQRQIDTRPSRYDLGYVRTVEQFSLGDLIGAIMAVDNDADARRFYDGYVVSIREVGKTKELPADVARSNIGWCFGEGMEPDRIAMWRRVCDAVHPVFGTYETPPTPAQAFDAGVARSRERGR